MKKLTITGNVGKDAEIKVNATTGELFATFSVGVSVGTKEQPKTDWIFVNTKRVDFAREFIKKGRKVLVEGFPSATGYVNDNGVVIASIRLSAHIIELLGKAETNNPADEATTENHPTDDQE
jgi:single-strand DNA-binding protein